MLCQVARVWLPSTDRVPPTAVPCVGDLDTADPAAAGAVTVIGACGLTPELPPAGEMAGGTLRAVRPGGAARRRAASGAARDEQARPGRTRQPAFPAPI